MIAGFNLTVRGATPFVMGSAQDATSMQFAYGAAPFVIANQEQGTRVQTDSRSRLTAVTLTNLSSISYSLDDAGNRTSVVTTCGPNGC